VLDGCAGESRGFGYVEIEDDSSAQNALNALNNFELDSLAIVVQQAKPNVAYKGSYKVGCGVLKVNGLE